MFGIVGVLLPDTRRPGGKPQMSTQIAISEGRTQIAGLVAAVRDAIRAHADWGETAGTDVTRVGSSARRYYDEPRP
jgi:hypothetical protein